MGVSGFISADALRARFAAAMDGMYRAELPAYGRFADLVAEVNARTPIGHGPEGLDLGSHLGPVRHGAIRLGTAEELAMTRRVFAVMGMHPVAYYDLSVAGLPVHSTAFRPVTPDAIAASPFRVFASLLRLDLIEGAELRARAKTALASRTIFSAAACALLDQAETQGGLSAGDGAAFVDAVLDTFRWRAEAQVDHDTYQRLKAEHGLIADVVSFRGPHINHLTPPTSDIDAVQSHIALCDVEPKETIEGPPKRVCPILLRQTAFKAPGERATFDDGRGGRTTASHKARFGEVESRGVALTPKGRSLYDRLLAIATQASRDGSDHALALAEAFADFPDNWNSLRSEGLAYFEYALTERGVRACEDGGAGGAIEDLLAAGLIDAKPLRYEDFLPVSAAGIFRSNLGQSGDDVREGEGRQSEFEADLGSPVLDPFDLYAAQERDSLRGCLDRLQPASAPK